MSLSQKLSNPEEGTFGQTWREFLFNVEMVCKVTAEVAEDSELVSRILQAGQQWDGSGQTTGRCATALYSTTGVSLVTKRFPDYLGAHLFALCLLWGLEVLQLDLPDRASEAAFALAQVYQQGPQGTQGGQGMLLDASPEEEFEEAEEEEQVVFPWEEPEETLPAELKVLWERSEGGSKSLDLRRLLEELPRWSSLPLKPKANNYRQDGAKHTDKLVKVAQQMFLHSLRVQACVYTGLRAKAARKQPHAPEPQEGPSEEDLLVLLQQLWQYSCDCYFKLAEERREFSLPGSSQKDDGLFGKEELQQLKFKNNVNRSFVNSMNGPQNRGKWPLTTTFRLTGRWQNRKGGKGWRPFGFGKGHQANPSSSWHRGGKAKGGRGMAQKNVIDKKHLSSQDGKDNDATGQGGQPSQSTGVHESGRLQETSSKFHRKSDPPGWWQRRAIKARRGHIEVKGGSNPFPEIEAQIDLVDSGSTCQGAVIHHTGCGTRMALPKSKTKGVPEVNRGGAIGLTDPCRLSGMWGSRRSRSKNHKIFGSLVHNYQKRGIWKRKTQVNHRLKGVKPIFVHKALQIRSLATHFSSAQKRDVGSKSGFKKCVFPSGIVRKIETLRAPEGRRKDVSVQCSMFWIKHFAKGLDGHNEGISKKMEAKRNIGVHLFRRHFVVAHSPKLVEKHLSIILQDLQDSGMLVNREKSILLPSQ